MKVFFRNLFHKLKGLPLLRGYLNTIEFKRKVQDRGEGVSISGIFYLSSPSFLKVGSHVCIGKGVEFRSEGGVLIGDDSIIGDDVKFDTVGENDSGGNVWRSEPRPILLGKGIRVGKGVCFKPGARVQDGGVIPEGSSVEEDGGSSAPIDDKIYTPGVRKSSLSGEEKGEELFFVLSTGRSGSESIARTLSQHPSIHCHHESKPTSIRLSVEHLHGTRSQRRIKEELEHLFYRLSIYGNGLQGESDHRFSVLLPYLKELLPQARFIWLVRNGRDFVSSAFSRGWFSDEELGYRSGKKSNATSWKWAYYRPQAHLCGEMPEAEWKRMTPFERNCWYWWRWNQWIEDGLQGLPKERWTLVRLEDLDQKMSELLNLLGVMIRPLSLYKTNIGREDISPHERWDPEQEELFKKWCEPMMSRLYKDQTRSFNAG